MPIPSEWDPSHPAVWEELVPGESRAITLRHPSYPFLGTWATTDPDDLISIAAGYLRKVAVKFGLPANLLADHAPTFDAIPPSGLPLSWLPLRSAVNGSGPLASIWVNRYRDLSGSERVLADRTAVILAVQSAVANRPSTALGSRLGIRIVAHVSTGGGVRITSSACSSDLARPSDPPVGTLSAFLEGFFSSGTFRIRLRQEILDAAGANPGDQLWFDGLRVRSTGRRPIIVEGYAYIQRPADQPYAFAYALTWQRSFQGRPQPVSIVEKSALIAHAAPVSARLFPQPPADQAGPGHLVEARPNRAPKSFEPYRQAMLLPGLSLDSSGNTDLLDDLAQVEVMQSKLVVKSADETQEETVLRPVTVPHARTNPFAALSGYQHARELLDTMRGYGFDPNEYFRHASWPLRVRYRAPVNPGPGKDGRTVNAQVDYDPPGSDFNETSAPILRPLQVRFALADLKRSASRREPLGLAADARWSWHEYSHVLLAASTGELELRFAHSAGDALAAIRWDPVSHLASSLPLRLATFPWVYLNRRHDRSVFAGWSWCGTYHRPSLFYQDGNPRRRKGYKSEQILSTSLFRLYRALGGDTVLASGLPDVPFRQSVSDCTMYLIMRAIDLLGSAAMMPTVTPDQFVTALCDADVGTWPLPNGWVGGCAQKVVRWAFEAQGLYATNDPLAVIDAPGNPPDIDVYIDNGRPHSEGASPRGGYMPVSLDWNTSPAPWHATGTALQVINDQVFVQVSNRNKSPVTGVVVRVSYVSWPVTDPDPPLWDRTTWQALGASASTNVLGQTTFGPFNGFPTTTGRYLILAEASCPGDLANTDPATGFPCSTQPTSVVHLVAGDNNLGLRLQIVP